MNTIFDFCKDRIETDRIDKNSNYRAKKFTKILELASVRSQAHRTKPGKFSEEVSEKNRGETAFQRALYGHSKINLIGEGDDSLGLALTWKDLELPIILSNKSRRRCVDLIGHTERNGTFLCEMKYVKRKAPPGNEADYAIFEGLLYFAIVNRDHPKLDDANVYRPPEAPRFTWQAVSDSRTVLILANDLFWQSARRSPNTERIMKLVAQIREELGVNVILCSTPDYNFFEQKSFNAGRYKPCLIRFRDEVSRPTFPRHQLIALF